MIELIAVVWVVALCLMSYAHGKLDHQLRVGQWWLQQLKQSQEWIDEVNAEAMTDDPDTDRILTLVSRVETLHKMCADYGDGPVDRYPFEQTRAKWAAWRARRQAIREVTR